MKRRRGPVLGRVLAAFVGMMLAGCSARPPGSVEDGLRAYKSGRFSTAFYLLDYWAKRGDPYAQYVVGVMYQKGEGVPPDAAKGQSWLDKAAAQGVRHVNLEARATKDEEAAPANVAPIIYDFPEVRVAPVTPSTLPTPDPYRQRPPDLPDQVPLPPPPPAP